MLSGLGGGGLMDRLTVSSSNKTKLNFGLTYNLSAVTIDTPRLKITAITAGAFKLPWSTQRLAGTVN